jgi:hypothetical protein
MEQIPFSNFERFKKATRQANKVSALMISLGFISGLFVTIVYVKWKKSRPKKLIDE